MSLYAEIKERGRGLARRFVPPSVRFQRAGRAAAAGGEPEVRELPSLVEPGTAAIDVGALVGDYAYSLCRIVGPDGLVVCVEPQPAYARALRSAARSLKLPMRVVECALSSHEGESILNVPVEKGRSRDGFASLDHEAPGSRTFPVSLRRLDDLTADILQRISFLKVDVEGHELEVLKGATETIRKHRPNLLVEIEQRHSPVPIAETFAYLLSLGYVGSYLDLQGRRRPLEEFDAAKNQESGPSGRDAGAVPAGYVSNFIFTPA